MTYTCDLVANRDEWHSREGHFEICSLVGTLEQDAEHLHISLGDSNGEMFGGHFGEGSAVYTTAEIVLVELNQLQFTRKYCEKSTWDELAIQTVQQQTPQNTQTCSCAYGFD